MPQERYLKFVETELPEHLRIYVARQDASLYTPIDHASWRFIMRISKAFFEKNGHPIYLNGLEATGIHTERIPLIEEMDEKMRKFGWRAVAVSGFIPAAAFLEFQAMGILPIACEMRTLEHLAYTPAPDIVHEAAGHAPIVADPTYRDYLLKYGEAARKAIFSNKDYELFEAIRALSDTKEDPASTEAQVTACQDKLNEVAASVTYTSEAVLLTRMAWWTTEYGLIGPIDQPKVFGAGLLSSVGESFNCVKPQIKKIPMTIDCIQMSFDITKPQPQLFVTPSFEHLKNVLDEFSKTMAYKKGGFDGLSKAKTAETVTTAELDSGVQVSGILEQFLTDSKGEPVFLKYRGPVQISSHDVELDGQGPRYHAEGFSTPLGTVRGFKKHAGMLTGSELESLGFSNGLPGKLTFESGIELTGVLINRSEKNGKTLLLRFDPCSIKWGEKILFQPDWGTFDLACGEKVVSVYGGAADRTQYGKATGTLKAYPQKPKTNLTAENKKLNQLYARLRKIREDGNAGEMPQALTEIHALLEKWNSEDWLLRLELLELDSKYKLGASWANAVRERLKAVAMKSKDVSDLIMRGLELV